MPQRPQELTSEEIEEIIEQFGVFLLDIRRKVPVLIDRYCEPFGITSLAAEAIRQIPELGDGATLTAIGERIGATPSTMTGVSAQLERLNYIERVPSPIDRRAAILRLTDEGLSTLKSIPRKMTEDFRSAIERFPDDDVNIALRIYRETIDVIDYLLEINAETSQRRSHPHRG